MSNGRLLCCWHWTCMTYYRRLNALVTVLYGQWNHPLCAIMLFAHLTFPISQKLYEIPKICLSFQLILFFLFVQASTISLSCWGGSLTRTKSVEYVIYYMKWVDIQFCSSILLYVIVKSPSHKFLLYWCSHLFSLKENIKWGFCLIQPCKYPYHFRKYKGFKYYLEIRPLE